MCGRVNVTGPQCVSVAGGCVMPPARSWGRRAARVVRSGSEGTSEANLYLLMSTLYNTRSRRERTGCHRWTLGALIMLSVPSRGPLSLAWVARCAEYYVMLCYGALIRIWLAAGRRTRLTPFYPLG